MHNSFKLPNHCSIIQAEILAFKTNIKMSWLENNKAKQSRGWLIVNIMVVINFAIRLNSKGS